MCDSPDYIQGKKETSVGQVSGKLKRSKNYNLPWYVAVL